jgi:hypothetical protein
LKVMDSENRRPSTGTEPVSGLETYPAREPTANEYVPFGSMNATLLVVELAKTPPSVTDQSVPDGRPVSTKVTDYATNENAMGTARATPATLKTPAPGNGSYCLLAAAIEYV